MTVSQTVVAAMITPALLVLASASLIATALVRLARAVDGIRRLAAAPTTEAELRRYERRAYLAERTVAALFVAIGVILVDGVAIALERVLGAAFAWVPIALTVAGMACIVAACGIMVLESRIAREQIAAEAAAVRAALGDGRDLRG
jgi:hypothetical protein